MALDLWGPAGASVSRWDPLHGLSDIQGEVNRLFDEILGNLGSTTSRQQRTQQTQWAPALDVVQHSYVALARGMGETPATLALLRFLLAFIELLTPTICIHSFPLPFRVWRSYFTEGAHVVTPSTRHVPPRPLTKI